MKDSIEQTIHARNGAKRVRKLAAEMPRDLRRAARRVGEVTTATKSADMYAHYRPWTLIAAAGIAGVIVGVAAVLRTAVLRR